MNRPQTVEKMIEVVKKLPGVGPKMAERLCYHILKMSVNLNQVLNCLQRFNLAKN